MVFHLHVFKEVSYEVGMAESVGICEAISYISVEPVSPAIPTSIHFLILIFITVANYLKFELSIQLVLSLGNTITHLWH